MALSGSSDELPLPSLLQMKAIDRGSCRVLVEAPAGAGLLLLENGRLVHGEYGGETGRVAAYCLLAEPKHAYQVQGIETGGGAGSEAVPSRERTMDESVQEALMEAMRHKDEGLLPRLPPAPVAASVAKGAVGAIPRHRRPQGQEATAEMAYQSTRRLRPVQWVPALLVVAVLLGAGAALVRSSFVEAGAAASPAIDPAAGAVEATRLVGPGDVAPLLEIGSPPASPRPETPLKPTVICRILIDREGVVRSAEVFRPRPDLEVFERRALEVVLEYRFRPAREAGEPVAVWINWPVDFV